MIYILIGILFFGLLIAVHEWGHFITAKLLDVRVNEFSIGMGPALLSRQRGETLYSLRLLPIGGYCAMEGEDQATEDPRSFAAKPAWRKLIILAAGSFMNYLAGLLIVVILFSCSGPWAVPVVQGFMDGASCAEDGGLEPGDRLLSVGGHRIRIYSEVTAALNATNGQPVAVTVERDGARVTLPAVSFVLRDYEVDGTTRQMYGLYFDQEEPTPGRVLVHSWDTCLYFARAVWSGLGMLVSGQVQLSDMSGPVGIVSYLGEAGSQANSFLVGLRNVCYVIALIAVNLAIMNLLPIPALDGGRIFLLLAGEVWFLFCGRRIDPRYEAALNAVFLVLLLMLMAVVTFSDIFKLVR